MNELFGLSMSYIMYGLLAVLTLALASIGYVILANRVMFKVGVRNIPRRRAQTTLIVLGLMLSTLIIAAAFTTGDTVSRSITSQVYTVLGSLDEVVQLRSVDTGSFEDESEETLREQSFPAAIVSGLIAALAANELVDFVVPAYSDIAVAVNEQKRLSAPIFNVLGLDPRAARGLPDIVDTAGGARLEVAGLGRGEIYVDRSAAEALDLRAGDPLTLIAFGRPTTLRVKAIVENKRLAGAGGISVRREGGVMPLAAVQEIFEAPGELTMVAVSNRGDARQGVRHSDAVREFIEARLPAAGSSTEAGGLDVSPVKQTGVNIAELGASLFTTFFLVFGLFSIGAGVLLIFMIFLMLAAERKAEMGMARAIGTKRADLVQMFLAEGMAYNLLAALVGVGLGVVVAFFIAQAMASLFDQFGLEISPHVTARSLVVSYSLGVVVTFLTVVFSSLRVSVLNIVRAIRDIPEPPTRRPQWRARGFFSTLSRLVFKGGSGRAWALRVALLLAGIVLQGAAGGVSSTALQAGLGALGGLLLALFAFTTFQFGFLFVIASIFLIPLGMSEDSTFFLLGGLSLLALGLALVGRSFGANERLTYTLAGLFLLYIWEFDFSFGLIEALFGANEGDIELFFLSGVMITVAATFVVVYNADLILGLLTRLGRRLGKLAPSIKMAVAYPLANRMRTGLTMAMFCLVVFALIVMSSLNHNFDRLLLSDRALGGWDVRVDENPTNPIDDLRATLAAAGSPALSRIEAVGSVAVTTRFRGRVCQLLAENDCRRAAGRALGDDFIEYNVWGDDAAFLDTARVPLQARAGAYDSDAAAWTAIAADPSLAIVDAGAFGEFGFTGFLKGVDQTAKTIDPVPVRVLDRTSGRSADVRIIGIIEVGASNSYNAVHLRRPAYDAVFGRPDARRLFVKTADGADNIAVAREIESALLTTGAQAESLRKVLDDLNATSRGFFLLLQGFMGLGLFVGVAAVGVIAFRTVVERRQQIGMLRALGYTRGMVGLTFLIESAFIAFMGVLSGILFGLILAGQLITEEFANQGATSFSVAWREVFVIGALAFGAALLMTLIPSRQAASIPIAQALRYE